MERKTEGDGALLSLSRLRDYLPRPRLKSASVSCNGLVARFQVERGEHLRLPQLKRRNSSRLAAGGLRTERNVDVSNSQRRGDAELCGSAVGLRRYKFNRDVTANSMLQYLVTTLSYADLMMMMMMIHPPSERCLFFFFFSFYFSSCSKAKQNG